MCVNVGRASAATQSQSSAKQQSTARLKTMILATCSRQLEWMGTAKSANNAGSY